LKRIGSIFLLFVFLFNVGGYYLLFVSLHHRADRILSERIDANQYDTAETIQLKIPVTLPYPLQENGFERVDGRFEHEGTYYKLIKHKLENDTVYVVCIRDVGTKQIATTLKDYVAKTNDIPLNSKSLNLFGKFLKDFQSTETDLNLGGIGWSVEIQFGDLRLIPQAGITALHGPPPKA
jgi:hypothetical protein